MARFFVALTALCGARASAAADLGISHDRAGPAESGYVVLDEDGALSWRSLGAREELRKGAQQVVYGAFNDTIEQMGTAHLRIETVNAADDSSLFEAMGYAEGYLTAHRTLQQMHNKISEPLAPNVKEFLHAHYRHLHQQAAEHRDEDAYWDMARLLLARQRGMATGLQQRLVQITPTMLSAANPGAGTQLAAMRQRALDLSGEDLGIELMRLVLVSDIDEIGRAVAYNATVHNATLLADTNRAAAAKMARMNRGVTGHCSALLKVAGPRLIAGHATWSSFSEMLRIWKDLSFEHAKHPMIANHRISFSSYPGYLASTDDWLVLPERKMLVTETTLDCDDDALLAQRVSPSTMNTPLRSLVASLLATTPRDWMQTFSRQNSGTQNNQWIAVDIGKWQTSGAQEEGVLWILEQMPGQIITRDETKSLREIGYWSSYNVPRFPETIKVSQYLQKRTSVCKCEAQRGPLFDEAQKSVRSVPDLQALLSTNTGKSSEMSWNCPKCAIASRMDVPGHNASIGVDFPESSGMKGCGASGFFGAIDAKVADDLMLAAGETFFVSGPPHLGTTPFQWGGPLPGPLESQGVPHHVGHPKGPWAFPWQRFGTAPPRTEGASESEASTLFEEAITLFA